MRKSFRYWRLLLVASFVGVLWASAAPAIAAQPGGLTGALLLLEDLPAGWVLAVDQSFVGEAACESACDVGPPITPAEVAGVLFTRERDNPSVVAEAGLGTTYALLANGLYRFAPGDAQRAFACLRDSARESLTSGAGNPANVISTTALPLDGLGDEGFGIRVLERRGDQLDSPFPEATAITDYVLLRRGETIMLIALFVLELDAVATAANDPAETLRLARIADGRLAALPVGP